VTLLVQAPLLPRLVRWARLQDGGEAARERRLAETTALEKARDALPAMAGEVGAGHEVIDQLRTEYDRRLRILHADGNGDGDGARQWMEQDQALRLAALAHKHDTVVRLRDEGTIDDEVLHRIQTGLDFEEVQIRHRGFGSRPAGH